MVKIKFKIIRKDAPLKKRFRGLGTRILINKKSKKTQKKVSPPLKPSQLNDSDKNQNFKPESRRFILVGLYDLMKQISEQNILPNNVTFSTIALFDNYLQKSEQNLSLKEMTMVIYACLNIIDKEQNINIFNAPFFKKMFNYELEYDILEIVDLEVYPKKIYDFFDEFYYKLTQRQKQNENFLKYLKEFKNYFLNYLFLLLFHNKSTNLISNFISCLIFTLEMTRYISPIEADLLENYIFEIKTKCKYTMYEYILFQKDINESICLFNNVYRQCKFI